MMASGLRLKFLRLYERMQRGIHYFIGPSPRQVEKAKQVLGGREYYQLYDDVYRKLREAGGSDDREEKLAHYRRVIHGDFGSMSDRQLVPPPPAALIDIGCGEGYNAVRFARPGHQIG